MKYSKLDNALKQKAVSAFVGLLGEQYPGWKVWKESVGQQIMDCDPLVRETELGMVFPESEGLNQIRERMQWPHRFFKEIKVIPHSQIGTGHHFLTHSWSDQNSFIDPFAYWAMWHYNDHKHANYSRKMFWLILEQVNPVIEFQFGDFHLWTGDELSFDLLASMIIAYKNELFNSHGDPST